MRWLVSKQRISPTEAIHVPTLLMNISRDPLSSTIERTLVRTTSINIDVRGAKGSDDESLRKSEADLPSGEPIQSSVGSVTDLVQPRQLLLQGKNGRE